MPEGSILFVGEPSQSIGSDHRCGSQSCPRRFAVLRWCSSYLPLLRCSRCSSGLESPCETMMTFRSQAWEGTWPEEGLGKRCSGFVEQPLVVTRSALTALRPQLLKWSQIWVTPKLLELLGPLALAPGHRPFSDDSAPEDDLDSGPIQRRASAPRLKGTCEQRSSSLLSCSLRSPFQLRIY